MKTDDSEMVESEEDMIEQMMMACRQTKIMHRQWERGVKMPSIGKVMSSVGDTNECFQPLIQVQTFA